MSYSSDPSRDAFRDSEERLKLALAASGSGVWDWNIATGKVVWSPELEAIHGMAPGTFAGNLEAVLADAHPEDRERLQQNVLDAIAKKAPHHIEYRLVHPDGTIRWVEARGTIQFDDTGTAARMVGICTDITARKLAGMRAAFLAEAGEVLTQTLDYSETLRNLAKITVPRVADFSGIYLVGADGIISRFVYEHVDPERRKFAEFYSERFPLDQNAKTGIASVVKSGKSELYAVVTEEMLTLDSKDEARLAALRKAQMRSAMIVPLTAHGRTYGALTFIRSETTRYYDQDDLAMAEELGRRAALAIENAKLYSEARESLKRYENELAERVRTEKELQNSNRLYRAIGDAISYGIWICDAQGQNIYASDSFLKLVGMTQEECSAAGWTNVLHPDDVDATAAAWKACVETRSEWDREHRFKGADGKWHSVLARGVPVLNEEGDVLYWVGINLDISRQKQTEIELRAAKEAADSASAAKTAFLANMSHEIRTPLGAILGFSDLLAVPGASPATRAESIAVIQRNGKLLSTIISDILDLSKVEAGRLTVEKSTFDLRAVLEETINGLRLAAQDKGITLSLGALNDLPHKVETDPIRLKQILNNIIGNAVKFTDHGQVLVAVKAGARRKRGTSTIVFEVEDTGPGISEESAQKLFVPFVQADFASTRRFGGTGLGLALSRHLARLLGGDVELIRSVVGEGCVFKIAIEVGTAAEDVVGARAALEPGDLWSVSNSRAALKGLRVLLVDDAPDNQLLIERLLKLTGAQVTIASNGWQGYEAAMAKDFDVVLMDLQMPVMDGYEATRRLRGASYHKPIIALTAHAMADERQRCLAIGFDDHLGKPIDFKSLVGRLRQFVDGVDRT